MTITRRWITDKIYDYLPVEYMDRAVDFLSGPPSTIYELVAAETGATPGQTATWAATATLGLYIVFVITLMTGVVKLLTPIFKPVVRRFTTSRYTTATEVGIAGVLWVLLTAVDTFVNGRLYLLELRDRLADQFAVVGAMPGSEIEVGMETLLWGILDNPTLEFAVTVTLLVSGGVFAVWYFYDLPTGVVYGTPIVVPIALAAANTGLRLLGVDVFPIPVFYAFLGTVLVLWLAVLIPAVRLADLVLYEFVDFWPRTQPQNLPPKNAPFYSLLLIPLYAMFVTPILVILVWGSIRTHLNGGMKEMVMKSRGYEKRCEHNPDTGENECYWLRGD